MCRLQSETAGGTARPEAFPLRSPSRGKPVATAPTRACFTSLGLHDPGGQAGSGGLLSYPSRACRPNGHPDSSWILLFSGHSEETRERLVAMGTGTVGQSGTPEPPSSSAASRFGLCCLSCPPPGVLSARRGPSATAGHRRCRRGRTHPWSRPRSPRRTLSLPGLLRRQGITKP